MSRRQGWRPVCVPHRQTKLGLDPPRDRGAGVHLAFIMVAEQMGHQPRLPSGGQAAKPPRKLDVG
ncbi:MAG: hypothetical protein HY360_14900 [Verrucomicrobia bacterium]|nr:hypothetical protein [Verrucomicrobiota bacterium]